jgi:hypothetical protein
MSRSVAVSEQCHGTQGRCFWVKKIENDPATVDDDSYEVILRLISRSGPSNPSITLVTRVTPRNYSLTTWSAGRSFGGKYYDEIN